MRNRDWFVFILAFLELLFEFLVRVGEKDVTGADKSAPLAGGCLYEAFIGFLILVGLCKVYYGGGFRANSVVLFLLLI